MDAGVVGMGAAVRLHASWGYGMAAVWRRGKGRSRSAVALLPPRSLTLPGRALTGPSAVPRLAAAVTPTALAIASIGSPLAVKRAIRRGPWRIQASHTVEVHLTRTTSAAQRALRIEGAPSCDRVVGPTVRSSSSARVSPTSDDPDEPLSGRAAAWAKRALVHVLTIG